MTYEQQSELLKWLIPMVFGQLTLLAVAIIHAIASANRGKESTKQNQEIIKDVAEVKGKLTGTGDGGTLPRAKRKEKP